MDIVSRILRISYIDEAGIVVLFLCCTATQLGSVPLICKRENIMIGSTACDCHETLTRVSVWISVLLPNSEFFNFVTVSLSGRTTHLFQQL